MGEPKEKEEEEPKDMEEEPKEKDEPEEKDEPTDDDEEESLRTPKKEKPREKEEADRWVEVEAEDMAAEVATRWAAAAQAATVVRKTPARWREGASSRYVILSFEMLSTMLSCSRLTSRLCFPHIPQSAV